MLKSFTFSLVLLIWIFSVDARCCRPRPINCYTCDSRIDAKCRDPFDFSLHPKYHPPLSPCNGCCVKMVQNSTKPNEVIRRMCTSDLSINLFNVDNICMKESSGTGHLCFCEDDMCNNVEINFNFNLLYVIKTNPLQEPSQCDWPF
nr:protein quiver-like [Onthophagus taurus]